MWHGVNLPIRNQGVTPTGEIDFFGIYNSAFSTNSAADAASYYRYRSDPDKMTLVAEAAIVDGLQAWHLVYSYKSKEDGHRKIYDAYSLLRSEGPKGLAIGTTLTSKELETGFLDGMQDKQGNEDAENSFRYKYDFSLVSDEKFYKANKKVFSTIMSRLKFVKPDR